MPQAEQVIDIPGVGSVAFPASMSPEQIDQAAAKLHREANPQASPQKPGSWIRTAVDWLPTAGGALGGLVGTAAGPLGSIGGAAAGGMVGKAMQNALTDDPVNPMGAGQAVGSVVGEGALQGGMQAAGAGVLKLAGKAGSALMTSAVKPAYKTVEKAVKTAEMPRVVKTLLDEGINVTQGGIGKLNTLLKATNDEIADVISQSGRTVDPVAVVQAGRTAVTRAGSQVAPSADKSAARGVIGDFIDNHARTATGDIKRIPVQRAQELKVGTYQSLGQRAYGETKGAALEAEKQLARGLKEGIERAHPNVKKLNAREGALIEAKDAIAKRVAQAANRDPAGIGWIAENPASFTAFLLSRSPAVKSMLARGLYSSASKATGVPENLIRFGIGSLASSDDDGAP